MNKHSEKYSKEQRKFFKWTKQNKIKGIKRENNIEKKQEYKHNLFINNRVPKEI